MARLVLEQAARSMYIVSPGMPPQEKHQSDGVTLPGLDSHPAAARGWTPSPSLAK